MKKTKVICTIGPSSNEKEVMKKMIDVGMNVVRINLSHASYPEAIKVINNVRELNKELNTSIAILLDTKGPEIRVGTIKGGHVKLNEGEEIKISMKPIEGTKEEISVTYPELVDDVDIKDKILLDDGLIELTVIRKNKESLICEIQNEGILYSNKGVNVPGIKLKKAFLSEKDIEDIDFALDMEVDFLALSYASCEEDILEVNDILIEKENNHMQVIAKVENASGVEEIDNIIKACDGVMVARGDLGVEMPIEKLPGIQKDIIEKCHEANKISIVATQLLDSMQDNPRPSRAEVSDIHNAVLDGTDAIMLSGETTIGDYPVEAVEVMSKIAESAEEEINYIQLLDRALKDEKQDITCAIARGVVESAYMLRSKVIIATSISGYTGRTMSHFRPICPIIVTSPSELTARSLALNWGVYSVVIEEMDNTDEIVKRAEEVAKEMLDLEPGDTVIITGGFPIMETQHTNYMKIVEVK